MRAVMAIAVAVAFVGSTAVAAPAPTEAKRSVYLCDSSAVTKRSFERDHGTTEFITAAQARRDDWSGARCMTSNEYQKLKRLELKQLASR